MKNTINKIKYLRLKPEERTLINILNNTTEINIEKNKILKYNKKATLKGFVLYDDVKIYKYNGQVLFFIFHSKKVLTWDRHTIHGRNKNLKVKTLGWCRYSNFWSNFKHDFELDYIHVQDLFNRIIGKYYNLELPIFEMETTDTSMSKNIERWIT